MSDAIALDQNETPGTTVSDLVKNFLKKKGTQVAAGVELEFASGETHIITSDADPILNRYVGAEEEYSMKAHQSARGGLDPDDTEEKAEAPAPAGVPAGTTVGSTASSTEVEEEVLEEDPKTAA